MKRILTTEDLFSQYTQCQLCPRNCGCTRSQGQVGACGMDAGLRLARAALHYWEEPCISGKNGSGAVFFSGCNLQCIFCQNREIATGQIGKEIPKERLVEIFLELEEKGANNINLVTPTHYLPHIIYAVERARDQGLGIPIVYNTGSYEKVDSIQRLEGIVDVYLPDCKYMSPELAARFSKAPDYPQVAQAAIAEMVRQKPKPSFYPEGTDYRKAKPMEDCEEGYLMGAGVIVRQLLLPGQVEDAKQIVHYLNTTFGNNVYLSMMSQYTPLSQVRNVPELNRKVTEGEYNSYIDYAIEIGVEQGFLQEEDVAEESFIPHFDYEGV